MSTAPYFFDIYNYPLLSHCLQYQSRSAPGLYRDYTGTIPGLYRDYTGTIPGLYLLTRPAVDLLWVCLTVRGAGTRPTRSATAASWACYGLAMDQLDRARRRHAPYRARPLPRVGLADQSCLTRAA